MVATNGGEFNSPAYIKTRDSLNGMLRLSNRLNLITFALAVLSTKRQRAAGYSLDDPLKLSGSNRLKIHLMKARDDARNRLICFVFREGLIGLMVNLLVIPLGMFRAVASLQRWADRQAGSFMDEAIRSGGASMSWGNMIPT